MLQKINSFITINLNYFIVGIALIAVIALVVALFKKAKPIKKNKK